MRNGNGGQNNYQNDKDKQQTQKSVQKYVVCINPECHKCGESWCFEARMQHQPACKCCAAP